MGMDLASYQIKKMDIKDFTQSQKLDHEVKIAQDNYGNGSFSQAIWDMLILPIHAPTFPGL